MNLQQVIINQELSSCEQSHLTKTLKIINDLTTHCSEHEDYIFDDDSFDKMKLELDKISIRYILEMYDTVEMYYQSEVTNTDIQNMLNDFYLEVKKEIYG